MAQHMRPCRIFWRLRMHRLRRPPSPNYPPNLDMALMADVVALIRAHNPNFPTDLPEPEPFLPMTREKRQAELDHYLDLLARPPIDERDLAVIGSIRAAFIDAQDATRALCARVGQKPV